MATNPIGNVSSALQRFTILDKNVIMTGATGGISRALAIAFAEAGADIVSLQIPNDPAGPELREIIEATGRSCTAVDVDLRNHASIQKAFASVWESGSVPDILFNCAGVTHIQKMEDVTAERLDNLMDINFRAAYLVSQEFGKRLIHLGRPGKIVHIASMAQYLTQTEISAYASSKAAVRSLTRAISNEWAGKGIQCNCISPGFIKTKMTESLWSDPDFSQKTCERTSLGRWGTPEDLVGVAIFLASRASDFITGEDIVVDGGVLGR